MKFASSKNAPGRKHTQNMHGCLAQMSNKTLHQICLEGSGPSFGGGFNSYGYGGFGAKGGKGGKGNGKGGGYDGYGAQFSPLSAPPNRGGVQAARLGHWD